MIRYAALLLGCATLGCAASRYDEHESAETRKLNSFGVFAGATIRGDESGFSTGVKWPAPLKPVRIECEDPGPLTEDQMAGKRHTAEQIVRKLREAEIELAKGH